MPQWLVVVASLFLFCVCCGSFFFRKQFLGRGSLSAQSQAHGQDRTVCSFSLRQPPWCETEGSNGRLAKRVLCASEMVCVLVGPKRCLAADSEAQYSTESPVGFSSSYLQQWVISAQWKFVCCLMILSCGCSLSSGRLPFFLWNLIEIHHRMSLDIKTSSLSFSGASVPTS